MAFNSVDQVMDYLHDMLDDHKSDLGLGYIGYADERLLPEYPAVVVDGGPLNREIHGASGNQFELTFTLAIWVYHANMSESRAQRTREDIQLAHAITVLFHSDYKLGGNVIFGYVDNEMPGIFNRPKGDMVVGTRLSYTAKSLERFT